MDVTPKLKRKTSLSLSTRINQNRHGNSSSKPRLISARETGSNCEALQRSPSVTSVCSDGGIECTPPHKRKALNLDDSIEFSPKLFDSSCSPTFLLSQSLAIDSPEVGWKWNRHSTNDDRSNLRCAGNSAIHTPDSAYAADSSFASAGSRSTDISSNIPKRSNSFKHRINNDARKVERRKILEQEYRRVENSRAEENLKQRCAKLQEQLKSSATQKSKESSQLSETNSKSNSKIMSNSSSYNDTNIKTRTTSQTSAKPTLKHQTSEKPQNLELFSDFFNDSADCFLLEATQEIESKIEAKTQPAFINFAGTTPHSPTSSECNSEPQASSAPAATTTPPVGSSVTSAANTYPKNDVTKEKRSSFYMKFLEDDCVDDWFISLDEVALLATHSTKPRISLQRYKSMPAETANKSIGALKKKDNNDTCKIQPKTNCVIPSEDTAATSSNHARIKRHSSTHAIGPAATNYRS